MPDEPVKTDQPQTPSGTPVTESPGTSFDIPVPYGIDPEAWSKATPQNRIEYLRTFHDNSRPVLEKYAPYESTISKFVEDESFRNLVDNAQKSFEAMQRDQDQTPPYIKSIADKVDRLDKFVGSYEEQQKQATQMQAAQNRIKALGEKYPDLAADNYKVVGELGNELSQKNISVDQFVDLVETLAPRLVSASAKRETPPPSMRGDASTTGVSVTPAPKYEPGKAGLRQRERDITRVIRKAAGGG